jgi:hypothetical protein
MAEYTFKVTSIAGVDGDSKPSYWSTITVHYDQGLDYPPQLGE